MMRTARLYKQWITRWPAGARNVYGEVGYGTPVQFKGRWEDIQDLENTPELRGAKPRSRIQTATQLTVGEFVARGQQSASDPTTVTGSYPVLDVREIPSIDGKQLLYEAYI